LFTKLRGKQKKKEKEKKETKKAKLPRTRFLKHQSSTTGEDHLVETDGIKRYHLKRLLV